MTTQELFEQTSQPQISQASTISTSQHSLLTSIVLHLLPGVAFLAFYLLAAPLVQRWGFPATFAGSLAILFILVPIEMGILLNLGRKQTGRFSLHGVIPYRQPLPFWQYLIFVPLLVVWYFTASSAWSNIQQDILADLPWLPHWLENPLPFMDQGPYNLQVTLVTAIFGLICSGVIAPIIEELYFRGYLLPRISGFGAWAVLLNVSLFALHHLWTPLLTPGRILAWLPIIFLVWWKKNIFLGLHVHLITNLAGMIGLLLSLLSAL